MIAYLKFTSVAAFIIMTVGCATQSQPALYYWGSYESILLDMYAEPGTTDTETQVQKLSQDVEYAIANDLKVAPGVYAHLGVMYARKGELANARDAFEKEKALYPESARLIDGMLERSGI